jgi:hypothetical protein
VPTTQRLQNPGAQVPGFFDLEGADSCAFLRFPENSINDKFYFYGQLFNMNNRAEKEAKVAVIKHLRDTQVLEPDTVLLNEFTANFSGIRADLVCANLRELHAYEIKSSSDTWNRVRGQIRGYSCYFTKTTFSVATKHLSAAISTLPKWVGIWVVYVDRVEEIRPATARRISKQHLIDMMLVQDLIKLLDLCGIAINCRNRVQLAKAAMKLNRCKLQVFAFECIGARYKNDSVNFLRTFEQDPDPKNISLLSRSNSKRLRVAAAKDARAQIWQQWEILSDNSNRQLVNPVII